MAQPTSSDVHVDAILQGFSVMYLQLQDMYVARSMFPAIRVQKQSDKYFIFDKNSLFLDQMKKRADGEAAELTGYKLSTDSYYADVFALAEKIGNQRRRNSDDPHDPDRNAVQHLTQKACIRHENQMASDALATSVWGTDITGAATADSTHFVNWNDYASSDPINDVEFGKETILGNTGFNPNRWLLANKVFRYVKRHPVVVDLMKYTSSRTVTAEILASMFDLENVFVAKAIGATNAEHETGVYAPLVANKSLLAYVDPAPARETPTAATFFTWDDEGEMNGGTGDPFGIRTWFEQKEKADYVEIEGAWDLKIVGTDLGYFFNTPLAAGA